MSRTEFIGNVKINYKHYDGIASYSDGDGQEEEMLRIARDQSWGDALHTSDKWHILYHFSPIRNNILEWYPFKKSGSLLEIGSGCGALSGMFASKIRRVVCAELSERRSMINAYRNRDCSNIEIFLGNFDEMEFEERFDYVTLIGVLEYAAYYMHGDAPFDRLLQKVRSLLKPDGVLLLAIENKMGMKYLNGAREDHLGIRYVGIEDYKYQKVRTFSKPELKKLMENNDFDEYSFYYPFPDYKLPETVYSDHIMPKEGEIRLWGTNYDAPRIANFNDAIFADQICRDEEAGYLSNSFLVVTGNSDAVPEYVHYAVNRKPEYKTRTVLSRKTGLAVKSYISQCERDEYNIFERMKNYRGRLEEQYVNVSFPECNTTPDMLEYAYLEGNSLEAVVYDLRHDPEAMVKKLKEIWSFCFRCREEDETEFVATDSYRSIFGDSGVGLKDKSYRYTNLDMLLQNMIVSDGKVYCIDFEWVFDFPIPMEFVKWRVLNEFYRKYNMYFSTYFPLNEFFCAGGLSEEFLPEYREMSKAFLEWVLGDENYLEQYSKAKGTLSVYGM